MKLFPNKPCRRSTLIWAVGCLFGLIISPLTYNIYSFFVPTPGNVVALNSDTINKVAQACKLLHHNSDLMGRYSHYTTPHTKQELFCMECSGSKVYEDDTLLDEPIDDGKTKLSQVHDDSSEINSSVGRIINSLSIQHHTLSIHLQRLRDQSYPK